ncbi:Gfo/Idh/MocA family protein [Candidatus Poribacteria bacterium]
MGLWFPGNERTIDMVKIALIGAGGIARAHARCLRENPKATIVGVMDTNRDAAEQLAAQHSARVYDNFDECLGEVDAVYVLTPPSFHSEYSVMAMEAGKHVLCEKPLATTVEDGEAMVDAARRNGVKLMTGFNHRFQKCFRRLKEIVDSGCLGEIVSYWCQRIGAGTPGQGNWRVDPELMCGMTVESLSHDIDLLRWMAGEVTSVSSAVYESISALPGFDNNTTAVMTLACGGSAVMHASWSSHLGRSSRGIIGTKGTAYLEGPSMPSSFHRSKWEFRTLRWKTADMEEAAEEELDETYWDIDSTYAAENDRFLDCVMSDCEPLMSGEDGLAALKISLAILRSHREQAVVVL